MKLSGIARESRLLLYAACLLVGVGLAFLAASRRCLWYDEAYTYLFATSSWPRFGSEIRIVDGPLIFFYAVMHEWVSVFGRSPISLRSFAILCSAATVVAAYHLSIRLIGRGAALLSVIFLCCHCLWLTFVIDARMYAPAVLFCVLSSLAWLSILSTAPRSASYLAYIACVAVTLLLHPIIGMSMLAAHYASIPFLRALGYAAPTRRVIFLALGMLVLSITIVAALKSLGTTQSGWIPPPTRSAVLREISLLAGRKTSLAACVLTLAVGAYAALRRRDAHFGLLFVWSAVPAVIVYIISLGVQSVWSARYMAFSIVPLTQLAAYSVMSLKALPARYALSSLIIICALYGTYQSIKDPWERWDVVEQTLAAHAEPGDDVFVLPGTAKAEVAVRVAFEESHVRFPAGVPVFTASSADGTSGIPCVKRKSSALWAVLYPVATLSKEERNQLVAGLGHMYASSEIIDAGKVELRKFTGPRC